MSKKTNTLFFILGATAFNVLITLVSLVLLLVIYSRLLVPVLPESAAVWVFPIIFIASIASSFIVYRIILKQVLKRVNMEKYFDPIFSSRHQTKGKH